MLSLETCGHRTARTLMGRSMYVDLLINKFSAEFDGAMKLYYAASTFGSQNVSSSPSLSSPLNSFTYSQRYSLPSRRLASQDPLQMKDL